jgi:hypothetical protein
MITDRQWNVFKDHVKPNATIEFSVFTHERQWQKKEGFLLETFPYAQDIDRVAIEWANAEVDNLDCFDSEGRPSTGFCDELRIQLCDHAEEITISPYELRYWVKGEFLEFDDVIALGDAP